MGAHVWLPGLRQAQPAAPPAHHRLDARLVRRLPRPDLLLPGPDRRHRAPVVRHPLQHRLQAGHRPRAADPAGRRLGVRPPGPDAVPGAGVPGRWRPCRTCSAASSPSTAATSPRPWRASSASRSACRWRWCSSAWWPGGSRTAGTGPWPPSCWPRCGVCHILPLFFAIGGAIVLTLMRFDRRRRLQWTLPGPGGRRRPDRLLGAALLLPACRTPPTWATRRSPPTSAACSPARTPGCSCWPAPASSSPRSGATGWARSSASWPCCAGVVFRYRPAGPPLERPGAALLVPVPVPARRAWRSWRPGSLVVGALARPREPRRGADRRARS